MVYPSPTSKWACTSLLGPESGGLFWFNIEIRFINVFTITHHYQCKTWKTSWPSLRILRLMQTSKCCMDTCNYSLIKTFNNVNRSSHVLAYTSKPESFILRRSTDWRLDRLRFSQVSLVILLIVHQVKCKTPSDRVYNILHENLLGWKTNLNIRSTTQSTQYVRSSHYEASNY